ncbi:MAG: hypothetical protein NCW75_10850 [Phycisphaera sp.]|nr:MAG: hypothetical protein NCW75_10850 [Phycisphaera sp.]
MMKKLVHTFLVVFGLTTASTAQIRLSHSLEEHLVLAGSGVACSSGTGATLTTTDNQWSRSFTLADFGIDEGFTVHTVEFGVEAMRLPTLPEGEITINLYQIPAGSPPIVGGELVGTSTVIFTPDDLPMLEVVTVDVDGSIDAGTALMVEIAAPDFRALAGGVFGDSFFIGGNSLGQTAFGYVASIACGVLEPEPFRDCGFGGNCHWVIIAEGQINGGCPADFDGDGSLSIFDFLAFQNAFAAGDLAADLDGDGVLTLFDFLAFQNEFDAGCE